MHPFTAFLFALPTLSQALHLSPRQSCPAVWSSISTSLQTSFAGCNDNARAAIRAAFHDCINNACDGSLIVAGECSRTENAGLGDICAYLGDMADTNSVSKADMIQFAAAAAIAICPLGPRVQALVGRADSSVAAPEGVIPGTNDSVADILGTFADKGFSARDVVALVGAHTAARQFFDDPSRAGAAIDSTPSSWDVAFYGQTLTGTAPYTFDSDRRMSLDLDTAASWLQFSLDQTGWNVAFTDAWNRFAVIGNDAGSLTDCSSTLPGAAKLRREAMSKPIAERAFHPKMVL